MIAAFTSVETENALKAIFEKHKNERICVIGTVCCGKTTLVKKLTQYNCIDMDDEFWHQTSKEEYDYFCQVPFTKKMYDLLYRLVYEKVAVKSGFPLFGVIILDCEVIVYLDISDSLLEEHCNERQTHSYTDALFIKECIEEDWNKHKVKNEKVFYYLTIKE